MDLGGEEESRGSRRSSRLEWSGVEENPPLEGQRAVSTAGEFSSKTNIKRDRV